MMTETRDPLLQSMFEQARQDLDGAELTASVMSRARRRLVIMAASALVATLAITLAAWSLIGTSLLEFAVLVSQFLTDPLIELGEGWLALIVLPINNLASILVATTKLALMAWKKLTGSSVVR
jgi:predicted membrane-bound spermidine synthase